MNPIRGNFLRSLGVPTAAILILVGCGDKEQSPPKQYNVTPSPSAPKPATQTAPETAAVPPPVADLGSAPAAEKLETGVPQQKRFDRNMKWLNGLASGDAAHRAAVRDEINKAKLPKAEMDEFEKQRNLYGIK